MSKKIMITVRQAQQFNYMRATLKGIAKTYQTPDQLERNCKKDYGLGYEETIGMAYENIQNDAACAAKGVSAIKIPQTLLTPTNGK